MADPLSITASIITIVHLSKKILDYLFDIKNAPKERTQFYGELSNLNTLLLYLRDRIDKTAPGDPWFKAACGLQVDEALGQFHSALESLISSLGGAHDIKKSRGLKSVKWPFEKKEVVTLLAKIERLKSLISLALTTGTAAAVQGIAETQALQEDRMKEAKRLQIADWVSPLNARAITREILKQREEGTGAWLLQSPEFQDWVSQKQRFLWLYGPPGAGKTILASIIVDELESRFAKTNTIVLSAFFRHKDRLEQTLENFVASYLKQLVQLRPLSSEVEELYDNHRKCGTRPTLEALIEILQHEIKRCEKVYIIIDALDECTDSGTRQKLLAEIRAFPVMVQLLTTSRPLAFEGCGLESFCRLQILATEQDLRTYIVGRLPREDRLARHARKDFTLQDEIVHQITTQAKGMFLLARLHMDSLASKSNLRDLRRALERLPDEIFATYDDAMTRIDSQASDDRDLAKQVLCWIALAQRPLKSDELRHALAVERGTRELDYDALIDEEILVSVCAGLVSVEIGVHSRWGLSPIETETFRFIHHTAEEYFSRDVDSRFSKGHTELAETCIAYLLFDAFERRDESLHPYDFRAQRYPFFAYAAYNWGDHARLSGERFDINLSRELLQKKGTVSNISPWKTLGGVSIPALHMASLFGLLSTVKMLLLEGVDANCRDTSGRTALSWAADRGLQDIVLFFCQSPDVIVDSRDDRRRTPLIYACDLRHREVVQLLLTRDDVQVNVADDFGRTPLMHACLEGNPEVVQLLLARDDVQVNIADDEGKTPLLHACEGDSPAVVQLLLEREDVQVNLEDIYGEAPLLYATRREYDDIVKLLLGHADTDIDSKDLKGRTAQDWANLFGHSDVMEAFQKVISKNYDEVRLSDSFFGNLNEE